MPNLVWAFTTTLTGTKIPPSLNKAVISVIIKEGNDKLECGSNRPISVLNDDYKMNTVILARRLEKILPL